MALRKTAEAFKERYPQAAQIRVTLYGNRRRKGPHHRPALRDTLAVMLETGNDIPSPYRETSSGGLATRYRRFKKNAGVI